MIAFILFCLKSQKVTLCIRNHKGSARGLLTHECLSELANELSKHTCLTFLKSLIPLKRENHLNCFSHRWGTRLTMLIKALRIKLKKIDPTSSIMQVMCTWKLWRSLIFYLYIVQWHCMPKRKANSFVCLRCSWNNACRIVRKGHVNPFKSGAKMHWRKTYPVWKSVVSNYNCL